MKPSDFTPDSPGAMVAITSFNGHKGWAYVPDSLPPVLHIDAELATQSEAAALALGRLNGLGEMLPNPTLLIQPFVRREALASSRIEGTRAEFDQLALIEASPNVAHPDPDIQEVSNYVLTLETGWKCPEERTLSSSFIMELHRQLMTGVRGEKKRPGELRSNQVLIGAPGDDLARARFAPPPPTEVRRLLDELAHYIVEPSTLPALVRLALIHYQFETIHPFLDGNGRLGRLLMPLVLHAWGLLDRPLLYLSEYFEDHRDEYVDHLYAVSQRGAWREWVLFTLAAIETQSKDAVDRGHHLLKMRDELRYRYQTLRGGRILHIIDSLFRRPTITVNEAADVSGITYPAANAIIKVLVNDGILVEWTGKKRNQIFLAPAILSAIMGTRLAEEVE